MGHPPTLRCTDAGFGIQASGPVAEGLLKGIVFRVKGFLGLHDCGFGVWRRGFGFDRLRWP